jgi:hypothetical protein
MNDDKVDQLLRGNVALESPEARERARMRLRAAIAREESSHARRRRRFLSLAAAAAAVVVGLLVLQVLLPPGSGGPRLSAAEEIRHLGHLSVAQASIQLGANEYIYRHYLEHSRQSPSDEVDYNLAETANVESWFANDGSGVRETTLRDVEFESSIDHQNWVNAGSPALPEVGLPKHERFAPGELAFFAVETLPTDPAQLRSALQNDDVIDTGEGDANLLGSIGILLSQENLSPELRQALFEVAASIPSVSVQYGVKDYAGRLAVSVMASDGLVHTILFFDQSDAQLLSTSVASPPADGRPAFTEWTAYLESVIVSRIGDRTAA